MYLEKFSLHERVAVVTGGGRNIGLACARALAEARAKIVIADIDEGVARNGLDQLARLGYEADFIRMNVADPRDVASAAGKIVAQHGKVDILVCNAGIGRSGVPSEDVEDERWLEVMDVNLNGVFWSCRAFGRYMLKQGKGTIVNVGSMSGVIVNKPQPQAYYNASKAAVHHLTKCLAVEWARRGIRVNAVAPTYIDTGENRYGRWDDQLFPVWMDQTPMARQGRCDEIASVVHFLACDASSLMTGSIVLADGGYAC
ncbi:SDR family oxidoreductase [Mesorhizobium sp.]|uniref:SDR family NAD(P)-dependent oxidoreductase n=1 Tax=Mesorhizobium sp. TaxID=1871066 RepID=UPI00120EA4B1|nr:SDR family oxidoreductase [Mesorhizobium sp.]TIU42761.1 MAG: SDR family oxidoreductase [Mesorhizobium sp.]TIV62436.1 MAG: SDR family oxidoreductase [Mesorhizobium sp.]